MVDRFEQRHVEAAEALNDVGERVVGRDVEISVDAAEHQIEVEQDGFVIFVGDERAARLTASVVQPTPPAAPVTLMIRGPWACVKTTHRGRASAGKSYRAARLLRRAAAGTRGHPRGWPSGSAHCLRSGPRAERRCGGLIGELLNQLDRLCGSWSSTTMVTWATISPARPGRLESWSGLGEPERVDPSQEPLQRLRDSSLGSISTTRMRSFMVFVSV